jgi:hypothetical protein
MAASHALLLIDVQSLITAAASTVAASSSTDAGPQLNTALHLDAILLCALRTLHALRSHCGSAGLDWTFKFFDSRAEGVGRTPGELREYLHRNSRRRSSDAGFKKLNAASSRAFCDACARVVRLLAGDPLLQSR